MMAKNNFKFLISAAIIIQIVFGIFFGVGVGPLKIETKVARAATGLSATVSAKSGASVNTTGTEAWLTPTQASTSDNLYAEVTAATFDTNVVTESLDVSSTAFSIPTNATITGIVVQIERHVSTAGTTGAKDEVIQIIKNGTPVSLNKASSTAWGTTVNVYFSYGTSTTDLWGTTWTPADFNTGNFGVRISVRATGNNTDIALDHVKFTVYYDTPSPVYDQANFRWYANNDSSTPATALANQNATYTAVVTSSTAIRLRMNVGITNVTSTGVNFKLQYATSATSTAGAWTDVGRQASTTIWRGYDNSSPVDGETIGANLLPSSTVKESYEEENNSTSTPNDITALGYGEWDWTLQQNGASVSSTYYFRMVETTSTATTTAFGTYTRYPAIYLQTPSTTLAETHVRWRNDDGSESAATWRAAEDTSATSSLSTAIRLRMQINNNGESTSTTPTLWYKLKSGGSCDSGGSFTQVPVTPGAEDWEMVSSTNVADSVTTTAQLTASGATFVTGDVVTDPTNRAATTTIGYREYSEFEYLINSTANATTATNYCFLAKKNGDLLDTYSNIAELDIVVAGEVTLNETHYRWYENNLANNWTKATSGAQWAGRSEPTSLVHNNLMWVMGGFDNDTTGGCTGASSYCNDVWYSTSGITWTNAGNAPWSQRSGIASLSYNNFMWVIGGGNATSYLNDVWYSTSGVTWTQATSGAPWSSRYYPTALVYATSGGQSLMWVIGGWDNDVVAGACAGVKTCNDVWYSSDGITWTEATSGAQWAPRNEHTSLVYNNLMWVIGGDDDNVSGGCLATTRCNDVWYSGDGITWTEAISQALWSGRYGHTSFVYNNLMWMTGGTNGTSSSQNKKENDIWYSSDGIVWTWAQNAPWSIRDTQASLVYDKKMWVFGGGDNIDTASFFCIGGHYCNDVWYSSFLNPQALEDTLATTTENKFRILRIQVNNSGASSSTALTLWYKLKSGSCDATGSFTQVPVTPGTEDWEMASSSLISDQRRISAILTAATGSTAVLGATVADPSNRATSTTLDTNNYSEFEFVIKPTNNATATTNYCFIAKSGSGNLQTYTVVPEIDILGGPTTLDESHYRWAEDALDKGDNFTKIISSSTSPATPWSPRGVHEGLVYDNKFWIMGGREKSITKNDVWYTTNGTTWTQATPGAAWPARDNFGLLAYDNKMWVLGGCMSLTASCSSFEKKLNDVWYSTSGISWTQATSGANWNLKGDMATVVYDNKMWIMGGVATSTITSLSNDVWYSTSGISWTQATSGANWKKRYGINGFSYNNLMWIVNNSFSVNVTGTIWYSSDGITWTEPTTSATSFAAALDPDLVYDNKIWVSTRRDSGTLNQNLNYSINGASWTNVTSTFLSNQGSFNSFINHMWKMGGYNGSVMTNDVLLSTPPFKAAEDTLATTTAASTSRLIVQIKNSGNSSGTAPTLWYGLKVGGTCDAPGGDETYIRVPATPTTEDWEMVTSTVVANGDWTAPILSTSSGFTFVNGLIVADPVNQATSTTLAFNNYSEFEFVIKPTSAAVDDTNYCFVAKSGSGNLATYTVVPEIDILGPIYTQNQFRWYGNNDSSTPSTALAALNTSSTVASGDLIRLRMNVEVQKFNAISKAFKLQFATSATTTSGAWTDVGRIASTTIWRGYNNTSTADAETLTTLLLGSSTVLESYEEENNSTSTPNTIPISGQGEWDWVIENNNATTSNYYFRMVETNSTTTALNTYTRYPGVFLIATTTLDQTHVRWRNDDGSETSSTWRAAEDGVATTTATDKIRLRMQINNSGATSGTAPTIWYKLKSGGSCDATGSFTQIPVTPTSEDWEMVSSTNVADSATTTAQLTSPGGTFVTGDVVTDPTNQASATTLGVNQYSEFEFLIKPTASANTATNYCFMSKRNGDPYDAYTNVAEIDIVGGPTSLNETHYRWFKDEIVEVSWTQATSGAHWISRYDLASLVFNNLMWVLGGYDSNRAGGCTAINGYCNDVWYSSDGIIWTQATTGAQWTGRAGHASLVFNNKMWVMGGNASGTFKNDVWYSSDGITWTAATSGAQWATRRWSGSVTFDNKLWVMGGQTPSLVFGDNQVWYSTSGVTWTLATANWVGRRKFPTVVFDNKIWVFGGEDAPGWRNDVWYSTSGITWTQATAGAGWSTREGHGAVVYSNKMWVMGGEDAASVFKNDVWYSTSGVTWTQTTAVALWTPRWLYGSLVYNNKMWVIGGYPPNIIDTNCPYYCNDVWYATESTPSLAGEDTQATTIQFSNVRLRAQINNSGVSSGTAPTIWYGLKVGGTCDAPGGDETYTQVPVNPTTEHWEMVSSTNVSDQDLTNAKLTVPTPSTFVSGRTVTDPSNQATTTLLDDSTYSEFEFLIKPTNNAISGKYCFIAKSSLGNLQTYTKIPEADNLLSSLEETHYRWYGDSINPGSLGFSYQSQATPFAGWSSRWSHGALVYNNLMWVMGGDDNVIDKNDVWYSTSGVTWTQATSGAQWAARKFLGALVFDNKMWVMGGFASGIHKNDVWYSTSGVTWTQAVSAAEWPSRFGFGLGQIGNMMLVVGGAGSDNFARNDSWYSLDGVTWTDIGSASYNLGARYRFGTIVSFNNKLWLTGGANSANSDLNDVWYTSDSLTWTRATLAAQWAERQDHRMLAFDNKLWVIGGQNGTGQLNDVWYSSDGVTWVSQSSLGATGWVPRSHHGAVFFNNKPWVLGGFVDPDIKNDVWSAVNLTASAPEDTSSTVFQASTTILRIQINNILTTSLITPTLWYAKKSGGTCDAPGGDETYTQVPVDATTQDWEMATSAILVNQKIDTNWLTAATGSLGISGRSITDPSNQATTTSLGPSRFAEFEFTLKATANATSGTNYCFITKDGSGNLNTYTRIPEISLAGSLHTQAQYRWYDNNNSSTPGAALAALNTSTTIASGTVARLRMNIGVVGLASAGQIFKLQFATSATTSTGAWTDVGRIASTTVWRGYNNTGPADGATTTLLLASSTVAASYEEENNATSSPSISVGGYGEWDWVLQANGAVTSTPYYFRMVKSGGTALDTYTNYPTIRVGRHFLVQTHYQWRNDDGDDRPPGMGWTQATSGAQWAKRYGHTSLVFTDIPYTKPKLWVIGGASTSAMNDVWYTVDGIVWTQSTSTSGWSSRYGHTSFSYNYGSSSVYGTPKIWVLGGYTGSAYLNDVWSFDGMASAWVQATTPLETRFSPRYRHASLLFNNTMWVLGGVSTSRMNDVWYSADGRYWTRATTGANWSARDSHKAVVSNNKMWVLGGWDGTTYLNDAWYSTDGVTWTQASSAPWTARKGHAAMEYFGSLIVSGGSSTSGGLRDVWFSMDGMTWTQPTSTADWPARQYHTMNMYDGKLWVLGGISSTVMNDVWYMGAASNKSPQDYYATTTITSSTRFRVQVFNSGDVATSVQLALYTAKRVGSTCDSPGGDETYTILPTTAGAGDAWTMNTSTYVTDQASATAMTTAATGSTAYVQGAIVTYPSNRAPAITIGPNQYTEVEYMLGAANASTSAYYCFIVQNDQLDRYDNPGQLQVQAGGTASRVTTVDTMLLTVGDGTTAVSKITITAGAGALGAVTANNNLRLVINDDFPMEWDASDTLATIGGTASSSVLSTVFYENNNKTLILDVTNGLSLGDTIEVSDLGFRNFTTAAAASTSLNIILAGAGASLRDATTDKTITVRGKVTLADSAGGLEANKIGDDDSSVTGAELFSFSLAPTGEAATTTQLVINLSDIQGFVSSDLSSLLVYKDTNGDGAIGAGETTVFASSGTVSISGSGGTITFNISSAQNTSTVNYILKGNLLNIDNDDIIGFSLVGSSVSSTGQTSGTGLGTTGSTKKSKHARVGRRRGGSPVDFTVINVSSTGGGTGAGGGGATTTNTTSTGGGGSGGGEAAP